MLYSIYESIRNPDDFPVNAFVAAIESSTFHWHNEYEMIGVLKGSIEVRIQSELVTLKENDVLFVNSNKIHALRSMDNQVCICMVVQMDTSLFGAEDEVIQFYLDSTQKQPPECGYCRFFKQMAKIVRESLREERNARFRLRAEVYSLIADLFDYIVYDSCFNNGISRNEQELVISFINYAKRHLEDAGVLEASCHELGVSRKTLDRNVKRFLGLTAREVIDNLRLDKAKDLLKNTGKNMDYIIDVCGFGSEKSFYRTFKSKTNLTPKAFREKGMIDQDDRELRGYLDFEMPVVKDLLSKIIEGEI